MQLEEIIFLDGNFIKASDNSKVNQIPIEDPIYDQGYDTGLRVQLLKNDLSAPYLIEKPQGKWVIDKNMAYKDLAHQLALKYIEENQEKEQIFKEANAFSYKTKFVPVENSTPRTLLIVQLYKIW
ncbi:MAG TPA: hypothetical protein VJH65_00915 [Candidatus Nanoarchaeia archaeon]|nr:hypothetical protein [Candidatus Nanoarchaeia archaeon]